ncbi:MAG: hypothetical protein QOD76_520 [Solirubrobacteraceae bacterium]|jgi:hypothetical protein|nr:hypothetical protein [Solirubrobacteraceae bacterium]
MRRVVPLLTVLACLLAPSVAGASARGGKRVLDECASTGTIANPGKYTHNDYEYARRHIPSDLAEYTTCEDEIRRAEGDAESQRHGGGAGATGGGGPGDTSPPTPQEQAAIAKAARHAVPVQVGGTRITPGSRGLIASSVGHSLPDSLLILLILLAAAVLARAVTTIRSNVIARRQA